jgi:mRNA-degrading endonuclease toxin of MazEF toxin-antitoxin module
VIFFGLTYNVQRVRSQKNKRPVVIAQRNSINRSKFQTVLVVPLTKQTNHANIPGNVLLKKKMPIYQKRVSPDVPM